MTAAALGVDGRWMGDNMDGGGGGGAASTSVTFGCMGRAWAIGKSLPFLKV